MVVPAREQRHPSGFPTGEETRIAVLGEDPEDDDLPSQVSSEEDDEVRDPDWELEPPDPAERPKEHRKTVLEEDWDYMYQRCPTWECWWKICTGQEDGEWPDQVKLHQGKMYSKERLCVPEGLVLRVMQAVHRQSGHLGVDRLYEECQRRFALPTFGNLRKLCRKVKKACAICAQNDPPSRRRYGKISRFPVPMRIWDSVAMDIFDMPSETFQGQRFDAMVVCVDRHTGWIIAIPTQRVGLTAEKVANLMCQKWMDMGGGIPSVTTSDRGPQFVGAWFTGMCARLGIRQAFSQAYRPQANGRAERAGRQVLDWLAKLTAEEGLGWVEALPVMLRQYHDAVGEAGHSWYEIVLGRARNLPGIPREPPPECEDVQAFFDGQEMVAEKVAKVLNHKH